MKFGTYIGEQKDIEAEVTYNFTAELPAKIYGLPEDCYPAEAAEIEIESVTIGGSELIFLKLSPAIKEQLEDEALQDVINNAIDAAEQKADWDRSQREQF